MQCLSRYAPTSPYGKRGARIGGAPEAGASHPVQEGASAALASSDRLQHLWALASVAAALRLLVAPFDIFFLADGGQIPGEDAAAEFDALAAETRPPLRTTVSNEGMSKRFQCTQHLLWNWCRALERGAAGSVRHSERGRYQEAASFAQDGS